MNSWHCGSHNVITLESDIFDNNIQIITNTIFFGDLWMWMWPLKYDNNKRLITLSIITLSGFYCISWLLEIFDRKRSRNNSAGYPDFRLVKVCMNWYQIRWREEAGGGGESWDFGRVKLSSWSCAFLKWIKFYFEREFSKSKNVIE